MTDLFGGAEERADVQLATNMLMGRSDDKFILRGHVVEKSSSGGTWNREWRWRKISATTWIFQEIWMRYDEKLTLSLSSRSWGRCEIYHGRQRYVRIIRIYRVGSLCLILSQISPLYTSPPTVDNARCKSFDETHIVRQWHRVKIWRNAENKSLLCCFM